MKPMKYLFAFTSVLSVFLPFEVAQGSGCEAMSETSGALRVFRIPSSGRCIVHVAGHDVGARSRSYLFSSNGLFMVFNVFGDTGSISRDTGARAYFIFPRARQPEFRKSDSGEVIVSATSGQDVAFSPITAMLKSFGGMDLHEDPEITATNSGGVELRPRDGVIILDTGWKTGGVAYSNPSGQSEFVFPAGASCKVWNKEIFDYSANPTDPRLRFGSDEELYRYLRQRCQG